jgi:predicted ester cyclase
MFVSDARGGNTMTTIADTAMRFFEACEAGRGWEACQACCKPDATFASQAEPLADIRTLRDYAGWMQGLMKLLPDGRYEVTSFATDTRRNNVSACAVFSGTHTGEGGPCAPTGKTVASDYVYVMEFDGDRIRHMTKIWNAGWALKQLGWA